MGLEGDALGQAAQRHVASFQRVVSRLVPGDVVEVEGSLRRRFWRVGAGAASRSEVEVTRVRRVASAG